MALKICSLSWYSYSVYVCQFMVSIYTCEVDNPLAYLFWKEKEAEKHGWFFPTVERHNTHDPAPSFMTK